MTVVTPVWPRPGARRARRLQPGASSGWPTWSHDLDRSLPQQRADVDRAADLPEPRSNMTPDEYHAHGRAREGIHPGRRHLPGRAVAALQPARSRCRPSRSIARCGASTPRPSCSILDFGGFAVVGSSPEILVRLRDDTVTIRPIAGTRPRGNDAGGGPRARRRSARRSEGAGRASDAARSRAQRCRPRRQDRHGQGHRAIIIEHYSPRHAHRLQRRGQDRSASTTRWTR